MKGTQVVVSMSYLVQSRGGSCGIWVRVGVKSMGDDGHKIYWEKKKKPLNTACWSFR